MHAHMQIKIKIAVDFKIKAIHVGQTVIVKGLDVAQGP